MDHDTPGKPVKRVPWCGLQGRREEYQGVGLQGVAHKVGREISGSGALGTCICVNRPALGRTVPILITMSRRPALLTFVSLYPPSRFGRVIQLPGV